MSETLILPTPIRLVRAIANIAAILIFATGIGIVIWGSWVREQPPFEENRLRHPPPPSPQERYEFQGYPKWFDLYYTDRVGYRDVLLDWHRAILVRGFGESTARLAWIGRNGWLFLNEEDPAEGNDKAPSVEERLEAWAEALEDRKAYLAARGIEYIVFVPPEKSGVYPEYLTSYQKRRLAERPVERLMAKLRERGVRAVDPAPAMREAKANELYYRLDTHWNETGARVAYSELAREIAKFTPGLQPLPDSAFDITAQGMSGDLARILGYSETERAEIGLKFTARNRAIIDDLDPPFAAQLPDEAKPKHLEPKVMKDEKASGPNAVLFRDSFGNGLLPFFRADFRRVTVVASSRLELPAIDAEKPMIVIQEMVARKLILEKPSNQPEVTGTRLRKR